LLCWGHHEAELVWKRRLKLSHYAQDKWSNLLKLASVVWDMCVWVSCNNSMPSETWLLCLVVSASESLMHPDLWCYFNFQLTSLNLMCLRYDIIFIGITNWSVIALHLVGYCSVLYFLFLIQYCLCETYVEFHHFVFCRTITGHRLTSKSCCQQNWSILHLVENWSRYITTRFIMS